MYVPKQNVETRIDVMHSLIRAHPLGVWVSLGDGELLANHIPFEVDTERGEFGTLVGHVARGNPIWKTPVPAVPGLVTFQGPEAYITPSWYPSKHEHGKAVPTWNYAVVHAHGVPSFIEDKGWLYKHVSAMTNRHEASQALPWAVTDAPVEYTDKMLTAIIGVEIPIQKLIGKWKMGQNRSESDQLGVVAGLLGKADTQAIEVARLMQNSLRSP